MKIIAARRLGVTIWMAMLASGASIAHAQSAANPPGGALLRVAGPSSPPGTRPDTSVVRDVRRALQRVPDMDDSTIHIRVQHGVVTLTGTVPETWQISRAANAARGVLGVRSVSNRLTLRKQHAANGQRLMVSAN
ncbi:BON domain-containing protein [Paraburkholderia sp. MMS20-SJTR3]|uniref:BON domain-containing protein n=1 Tax=Paraburkholderia sejongensis TaxID=2886946 RepID=A0ABS8JYA2_9BURK|nr:BON domain-containing protein [Paraburkholderia sp. MMS20-SJTR3]MCC8394678.1 BON domain-containing protein [Paraburkholderia sp. MMS20-SJTR3]